MICWFLNHHHHQYSEQMSWLLCPTIHHPLLYCKTWSAWTISIAIHLLSTLVSDNMPACLSWPWACMYSLPLLPYTCRPMLLTLTFPLPTASMIFSYLLAQSLVVFWYRPTLIFWNLSEWLTSFNLLDKLEFLNHWVGIVFHWGWSHVLVYAVSKDVKFV